MPLLPPINFPKWLEEHSDKLQPPVNNFLLQRGDFIIMEWFYQYKGEMCLKIVDDGEFKDIPIREGEMFLLPANTPHNPVRFANTVGIVIERNRRSEEIDRLRWYCEQCKEIVYEESFHCTDLGTQLKPIIQKYAMTEDLRKCKLCGNINSAK
ncbi:3-hydroxyanthranilate 3,4-dioxygenase [Rhizophagus irregularis DAOM 197198w]|uniref:3-hydroxyanthranilate 3,4-dioxygenase n=1 Tax=Rhizophagus irregularis (strain DAOM 197198w) TaxID=1432141 RepID=A0A015JVQ7_RHIIW|nr:3-hydroxyanthranilate 3,4-dioxygenase [Rhizophagus irregularis DAOM 197198w]